MFVDFTAQSVPTLWVLVAALAILAMIILASVDPELAEVYFGDAHILIGTLALAALALVVLGSHHVDISPAVGQLLPAR